MLPPQHCLKLGAALEEGARLGVEAEGERVDRIYKLVDAGAGLGALKFTRAWTSLPGWGPFPWSSQGLISVTEHRVRKIKREVKGKKGGGQQG